LDITQNSFDDTSAQPFAEWLINTNQLVYFDISRNKFTSTGVKTFVEVLLSSKEPHRLKLLGLNSSAVESEQLTLSQLQRLAPFGIVSLLSPEGSRVWWRL
jgi:hypothetical protein